MTAEEIKRAYKGGSILTDEILAEIAIQLAELKHDVVVELEKLNERLSDYFQTLGPEPYPPYMAQKNK